MWPFDDDDDMIYSAPLQTRQPQFQNPEEERGFLSSALHYLNMPSGAVSGAAEYLQGLSDDEDLLSAISRGATEQPGYNKILRNTLGDEFMDEDPFYAGTAIDIALQATLDPLIFLTPAKAATGVKALGRATGATDVLSTGANALKNSRAGNYVDDAFNTFMNKETKMFTDTPITWRRALSAQGPLDDELAAFSKNRSNLYDEAGQMATRVGEQPEDVRRHITNYLESQPDIGKYAKMENKRPSLFEVPGGEGLALNIDETPVFRLDNLSGQRRSEVLQSAKAAGLDETKVQSIFNLGEEAATLEQKYTDELVKRGIISEQTAQKFAGGRHIRREYLKHENPSEYAKMLRESGLEKEAEQVEKTIRELEVKYSKGHPMKLNFKDIQQRMLLSPQDQEKLGRIMDATHPLAQGGRISSDLISKFDFLEDIASRYGTNEAIDGYYHLSGKGYGPLNGMYVPREIGQEIDVILKEVKPDRSMWRKIVSYWKMGKTILNPASHARNFFSNATMMNAFGGISLLEVPIYLAKAAKEMKSNGKLYKSAKEATNIFDDTFVKTELGQHLVSKGTSGNSFIDKAGGVINKGIGKAGDLYQGNEKLGKLAVYMYGMERLGMNADEAGKFANKVLFDYGKVPPWVKWLRESGVVPFASFPYLAGLETGRTLWNNPATIGKYYKMSNTGTEEEKAERRLLPDYLSPDTMLPLGKGTRTVNGQEQEVNNYLDLQYILPFDSGFDLIPGSDGFNVPPALDLASALISGKDNFTGRDIVSRGMSDSEKAKAYAQYAYQSLAPSFAPPIPGVSDGGYSTQKLIQGVTGSMDSKGRTYSPSEAIGHTVFGLKNTPVNIPEQYVRQIQDLQRDMQAIRSDLSYKLKDRRLSDSDKQKLVIASREKMQEKALEIQGLQNRYRKTGR